MSLAYALLCAGPDVDGGGGRGSPLSELPGVTERELIVRLRRGDEAAFAMLYRTLHPRLVALAEGYTRSAGVAEELAQDTLLIAWDRREQWQDDDRLIVYLYATVRNRALKHLRHERVVARTEAAAEDTGHAIGSGEPEESPADTVEREDLEAAVQRAVDRLPDMQRTAFTLRWIHQLDYDEIAAIMGITATSARKHVSRARAAMIPIVVRLFA